MPELVAFLKRLRAEMSSDHVSLVAAGVAFYGLLAIFPAAISVVAVYGLVADPQRIRNQLASVTRALPPEAASLITNQLTKATDVSSNGLSLGLSISLIAALWAAAGGVRALITGLNIIFDLPEGRGFLRRAGVSLVMTLGAIVTVIIAVVLVAAFPVALRYIGLSPIATTAAQVVRWLVLLVLVGVGLAVLYRWGPASNRPRWRWISWGTATALTLWIIGSIGFSAYVSNFGNYNKTYGSLAAVVVLMFWLYLSAYAVLLGAQIDAVRTQQAGSPVGLAPKQTSEPDPDRPPGSPVGPAGDMDD